MAGTARTIAAEEFNDEKGGPYRWGALADTDARDGQSTLHFEWADANLNLIGHDADEVPHTSTGLTCEMLFRHRTHTQALLILNTPAVVVVAPPDAAFAGPAGAAQLRA